MTRTFADTGEAWLGQIPVDWRLVPAKAAFAERREPCTQGDVHLTPSQVHGVLPQAQYMDMTGNRVVLNLGGQDNMKHVEPGDFIIHLRSFQGGLERSTLTGKVSTAYTVLSPRPGVEPDYYRWLLKSDAYIQQLRTTTNQLRDGQSIKYRDFTKFPLPLPPINEQRAIADYLHRETTQIDTLIEEQRRLVGMLRERRSAVIASAVTIGVDGAALVDLRNKWIGRTPLHWASGKIKHAGLVTLGKMLQPADSGSDVLAPYMRAANVQPDGALNEANVKKMWFKPEELSTLDLRRGDVVVVEGGVGGYGRAAFLNQDLVGWGFQNSINRIRPNAQVDGRYVAYFLIMARAKGFIEVYCNVVSMPHLTAEKLNALPVPLPPLDEQRRIATYLDEQSAKIDALITQTERFIELSRERRSALITAAVTGQIDVRGKAA